MPQRTRANPAFEMPSVDRHSHQLLRAKHERPEWKKEISLRMREMDSGKKITLAELKRQIAASEL